ncbi:MAG TPA: tagaturonate epimerase family protein, partial [Acidobacteriaceae bacterium]|nr:tagaturonate epimerase family protein [Acidobacteriaceae bacterium]
MSALQLGKFSLGVGDRFAHQAKAQLQACIEAQKAGVEVIPVWNKSNREHNIIGSEPYSTRAAADAAVKALHWTKPWYCDADHINLTTVDRFLAPCDFYTIDVADYIGKPAQQASIDKFLKRRSDLKGKIRLDGLDEPIEITPELLQA